MSDNPFDDIFAELELPLDPIRQISQEIEDKKRKLEQRKAIKDKINEAKRALKEQMEKLNAELAEVEDKLESEHTTDWQIQREIRELERKVEEEEHKRKEAERLAEIERRKNIAMAGFRHQIEELSPEWEKYPHDYQWEGAGTLALMGSGLLGDEMGLGKTLTAIMWLDFIKAKRVLIVAPNETVNNFGQEVIRWAPHRFTWTFAGNNPKERRLFMDTLIQPRKELDNDFTVCVNYEQLYQDKEFVQRLKSMEWDAVIIDEAHNMKDKKSLLFQRMQGMTWGVPHILPMTGTFILNQPQDIWTSLHLIDPNTFYNEQDFLHSYCEFNYSSGKWHFRSGGVASLVKHMQGRIVMRSFDEVARDKIPAQYMHETWIDWVDPAYPDQRKVIKQLAEHSQIVLDMERKSNVIESLALITRNRQAINWPAGITLNVKNPDTNEILYTFSVGDEVQESIKMDWVEAKAKELQLSGKRIVVFSQFKTVLAELERRLAKSNLKVVRYDGDTDDETRKAVKNDFDRRHVENRGGGYTWDIVLCNFKTGGVGLNFTHATETIIFDEEWNPGKNEQAYRRTKRMGQTEETHVYIPRVTRSIDEWLNTLNIQKRQLVDGFNLEVDLTKEFSNFLEDMLGD
jgi:SNF2 family DNA or RNA helicase